MASNSLHFAPDPARGAALDQGMRADLAGSLEHIAEAARGVVAYDEARVSALIGSLRRGVRYSPYLFATYFKLAEALLGEDLALAERLFGELTRFEPITERFRIAPLGEGPSGAFSERYADMMCEEGAVDMRVLPPDAERARDFIARLHRAMALLDKAAPEASGEIRAIIDEIVVVSGDPTRKFQFDGGSHYQLWGALFLNCDHHPTDVAAAEVLAHESGHSFLFGCCRDEMLVLNEDEELFTSPLRPDPRPMDGIYHATFVSARMHWVMSRLVQSGVLDPEAEAFAAKARTSDAANFAAGLAVVEEHGRLTPTGAALMQAAKDYMAGCGPA